MRLVHLSDLHLGYRQFQRQTAAGINQREADVAAVFRATVPLGAPVGELPVQHRRRGADRVPVPGQVEPVVARA